MISQKFLDLSGNRAALVVLVGLLASGLALMLVLEQTSLLQAQGAINSIVNMPFRRRFGNRMRGGYMSPQQGYRNIRTDLGTIAGGANLVYDIAVGSNVSITNPDATTTNVTPNSAVGSILVEIFAWIEGINNLYIIDTVSVGYYVIFNPQNQIALGSYPNAFGFVGSNIAANANKRAVLDWGTFIASGYARGPAGPCKVLRVRIPVPRMRVGDHLQLVLGRVGSAEGVMKYMINHQYYYTPP